LPHQVFYLHYILLKERVLLHYGRGRKKTKRVDLELSLFHFIKIAKHVFLIIIKHERQYYESTQSIKKKKLSCFKATKA